MELIQGKAFDVERAFYGRSELRVRECLRYPFWHDLGLRLDSCELTEKCRAALWYSEDVVITGSALHGIKALRECADVTVRGCGITSPEFGWSVRGMTMENCSAESEYFMLRARDLKFTNVKLKGKYSFQYIEDSVFEGCTFDTKDAFWHARNVAWYCENVTFENCTIIGTQPLCYCRGLRLVNCEMIDTDLAFERSEVEAELVTPVVSIKNPLSGRISVPAVGELIRDIPESRGEVVTGRAGAPACA